MQNFIEDIIRRILVIGLDQEVSNRLFPLLEGESYKILKADNEIDSLQFISTKKPDIVICNSNAPDIDSIKICKALKSNINRTIIPIIILSNKENNNLFEEAMNVGADYFLTQSNKLGGLISLINSKLQLKEALENLLSEAKLDVVKRIPTGLTSTIKKIIENSEKIESSFNLVDKISLLELVSQIKNSGQILQGKLNRFLLYSDLLNYSSSKEYLNTYKNDFEINPNLTITHIKQIAEEYERLEDIQINFQRAIINLSKNHFYSLLTELAANSFKFSPRNSKIIISGIVSKQQFQLRVVDYGIGFYNKKEANNILDQNKLKKEVGPNLGLAIVKEIVELGNGTLLIDSKKNCYTVVEICLPLKLLKEGE